MDTRCKPLDLATIGELSFFAPDEERFPATRLAREAAHAGGAAPAVLNAANEVAVAAFLAGQIRFTQISAIVARTLDNMRHKRLWTSQPCWLSMPRRGSGRAK